MRRWLRNDLRRLKRKSGVGPEAGGAARWFEISVEANAEACEAVAALFDRYGRGCAVVETLPLRSNRLSPDSSVVLIKAYLPSNLQFSQTRRAIEDRLGRLRTCYPISETEVREFTDQDWAWEWKKGYQIQKIGQRLVIVPSWEKYTAMQGEAVMHMDPGMAFGSGLHPTTRLCLVALERHLQPGQRVLDIGTGSGIQAIAAVKLGAGSAVALDTDATAVAVARQNASLNGVLDSIEFFTGKLEEIASQIQPVPLIVVNILACTIINMIPYFKAQLAPDGHLITGGILNKFSLEVEVALMKGGFEAVALLKEEDWISFVVRARRR